MSTLIFVGPCPWVNPQDYKTSTEKALKKTNLTAGYSSVQEKVIFIDGGLHKKAPMNLPIDHDSLALGDGDSLGGPIKGEPSLDLKFPQKKNSSDFALALAHGLNLFPAAKSLHLFGLWGGRLDHQLAIFGETLLALDPIENPLPIFLYNSKGIPVALFLNGTTELCLNGTFSLMSLSPNSISLTGHIEYQATELELKPFSSQGISNSAQGLLTIEMEKPLVLLSAAEEDNQNPFT